jgi:hypothetical protein
MQFVVNSSVMAMSGPTGVLIYSVFQGNFVFLIVLFKNVFLIEFVESIIWEECHSSPSVPCDLLDILGAGSVVEGSGWLLR